jgi:two-component sensor histidine kinase
MNIWKTITHIGIKPSYEEGLKDRIILTNQYNVLSILIYGFSGLNNYSLGDTFSAILLEGMILVGLFCFYLQKVGVHRLGTFFLFTSINCSIFYFDSYSGFNSGTYLYHFPLVFAVAFLYDWKSEKQYVAFHFLLILTFITTNAVTNYQLFSSQFLTNEMRQVMFVFNITFSFSSLGFFVYLMVRNREKEKEMFQLLLSESKRTEQITANALNEKNTLIAELHHRVKNNLAIISSLFNLKINDDLHEDAKNVLVESRNRVRSMALIHNQLYKDDSLTSLNFPSFATLLIEEINSSYPEVSGSITVTTNFQDTTVAIDDAIPCGLILNELLTNCYKHAFIGRYEGMINVSFEKKQDYLHLMVCDNGVGLPDNYNEKSSLGMTVIEALAEQLEAKFEFTKHTGTCFKMSFKA